MFDMTLDASDARFYDERNRPAYLRIHAEHPVYRVDAAHSAPFWNVCTHDLIREVGKNAELFTTEHGVHLENTAFETAGTEGLVNALRPANILPAAEHRRVRAPLNPHFRHDVVARMEHDTRAIVRRLLDDIEPGVEVDFMAAFAARVPLQVTALLLGVGVEREHDFARWADAILTSFEPGSTPDWDAIGALAQFFTAEIAARKTEPRDDLISAMLATDLAEQEVLMWCCILLAAGIETTGNLIGGGMDLLLRHPEQLRRLCEDAALVRPAVAEMLRVITPGRYIRRTATAATELGGHAIDAGDAVVMNFTVANYDPALFADPLRFDVARNPNDTLAFSYGPHRCIGMPVARLESTVAFEELLARFGAIEARGPAVLRPSLATAVVERLPVVFNA
ncbi:MAG TPA: cytochrome P450 [Solirubrobacteraceae bacterium]